MTNRLAILCAIVLTTLLLAIAPGCAKAVFEYSNLIVSPQEVESGQSVTVSVNITNTGSAEGICPVLLKLDGVQIDNQNIAVGPGNNQSASFQITREAAGTYTIDVNGLITTFKVLEPANFQVSKLVITPTELLRGSSSAVTVNVTNVGEVGGDYEVILKVNGEAVQTKKVAVAPGGSGTVDFSLINNEAGTFNISVGGLTEILKVNPRPANLSSSGFTLTPAEVAPCTNAYVTADVTNTGDIAGEYEVTLKVNGEAVQSKRVTVTPGTTATVSFTLHEEAGTYDISIGSWNKTLTVREGNLPTLNSGDKWIYRVLQKGATHTVTHTVTGEEKIGNYNCYAVKMAFAPYLSGGIQEQTEWWDKKDLDRQQLEFSTSLEGKTKNTKQTYWYVNIYSYEGDFKNVSFKWPRKVGSEWSQVIGITKTEATAGGTTTEEKLVNVRVYRVERIETVSVPAGDFRCYKIVTYEGIVSSSSNQVAEVAAAAITSGVKKGGILGETWYSDQVKAMVKSNVSATSENWELLAYSVK